MQGKLSIRGKILSKAVYSFMRIHCVCITPHEIKHLHFNKLVYLTNVRALQKHYLETVRISVTLSALCSISWETDRIDTGERTLVASGVSGSLMPNVPSLIDHMTPRTDINLPQ